MDTNQYIYDHHTKFHVQEHKTDWMQWQFHELLYDSAVYAQYAVQVGCLGLFWRTLSRAPGSHSEDITLKSCHSLVRERRETETRSDKQHRAGYIWSQQRQQTGEQQAAEEPTATQRCGTDGGDYVIEKMRTPHPSEPPYIHYIKTLPISTSSPSFYSH